MKGGNLELEWLLIEGAPMDGTEVLVYYEIATVGIAHLAFYRGEQEWLESGQYCGGWDTLDEWLGWWSYTQGSVTQERLDGIRSPTHYLPSPALPK